MTANIPQMPTTPTAPTAPTAPVAAAPAAAPAPGPAPFSLSGADATGGRIENIGNFHGSFWLRVKDFSLRKKRNGVEHIVEVPVEIVNSLDPTSTVSTGATMAIMLWEKLDYSQMFKDQVASLLCGLYGADSTANNDYDAMLAQVMSAENPTVGNYIKVDVIHSPAVDKTGAPKLGKDGQPLTNRKYRYNGLCTADEIASIS